MAGEESQFTEKKFYRKKFLLSIIIPLLLIFLIWLVKIIETLFEINLTGLGIFPLTVRGLPGIIFSPFIHENFRHLLNNTLPLFLLLTALFFFYSEIALKVLSWTWLLTGILVWAGGREAWHIGASGLIYGIASFLFFSGIIRKYFRLIALSLLIVFLYGEMVWGIFPGMNKNISWESHMLGFASGIILAIAYRKQGPQMPVYEWMEETDSPDTPGTDKMTTDNEGDKGYNLKDEQD